MQTVCVVVVVGVGVVGDAGQKLRGAADDVLATEPALSRPLPATIHRTAEVQIQSGAAQL